MKSSGLLLKGGVPLYGLGDCRSGFLLSKPRVFRTLLLAMVMLDVRTWAPPMGLRLRCCFCPWGSLLLATHPPPDVVSCALCGCWVFSVRVDGP